MIWKTKPSMTYINTLNKDSMAGFLGIEITEFGDDYVKAKMPVNERTKQPMGLLHGGASVVLSETIGSIASFLMIDADKQSVVGIEVNANHIRGAKSGYVYSITKPIKTGRTIHIWQTDIYDELERMICTSRLTVMVVDNDIK
ncbi:MAG: hotdog fold thioesterase [Saprospiraceae bacterium]|nr:hotdog fold thioesterase [Saprospiraceae bacterium]